MTRFFLLFSLISSVLLFSCEEETVPDSQILIDDQLIRGFTEANNLEYTVSETGLRYAISDLGSGAMPEITDTVLVHYRGTFLNGREFDSSRNNNEDPAEFTVIGVVPGFTESLLLLSEGGKGDFVLPSRLAYGAFGTTGIPANAVVRFEVELIEVK